MNNMFKRIRTRRGFTMIELIVVVAIIGVLLAMILPGLFSNDKSTKAKAYAESYFYTAQSFASKMKIANDPATPYIPPVLNDMKLYTTVDSSGTIVASGIVSTDNSTMTDSVTYASSGTDAKMIEFVTKFARDMEQNLTPGEFAGTFYVIIDDEFVVRAAYWSDGLITDMRTGNTDLVFENDNQLSGYVCCAYPAELSEISGVAERRMFRYF